jgi:hypothetical protein
MAEHNQRFYSAIRELQPDDISLGLLFRSNLPYFWQKIRVELLLSFRTYLPSHFLRLRNQSHRIFLGNYYVGNLALPAILLDNEESILISKIVNETKKHKYCLDEYENYFPTSNSGESNPQACVSGHVIE